MFFRDIIGQEDIKRHLIQSVQNGNIAHAQLFYGKEGVGKLALALAYGRYVQCTGPKQDDACGVCPSCVKYSKFMHPDLHFVFPVINKGEGTSSDTFINEWRHWLTEHTYFSMNDWLQNIGAENKQGSIFTQDSENIVRKLNMKSYESEYKVLIIWLPEKMNETAANKLLKNIEEPYDKTLILMVSNDVEQVLGTIVSRSQRIAVPPIPEAKMATELQSRYAIIPSQAQQIAHLSNGSFLKALQNLSVNQENSYLLDLFMRMMRLAYARKLKEMKLWSDEVAGLGREKQKQFLAYAQHMIRENFIQNFGLAELSYQTPEEQAFSNRFYPFVNHHNTQQIMEELALAEEHITQNVNAKMVFFDLSLKFIMLLKTN